MSSAGGVSMSGVSSLNKIPVLFAGGAACSMLLPRKFRQFDTTSPLTVLSHDIPESSFQIRFC